MNQTLYCSQTTAETETETVEYIGEITSQPPSIAARSIMHTKVNCSLISATRRTTCFFIRGFGELPQTCGTGEQSRTCSGMFQVSNVFFALPRISPKLLTRQTLEYVIGSHVRSDRSRPLRATHLKRLGHRRGKLTDPPRASLPCGVDYCLAFLFFKEISVGSNCVGLGRKEEEYWPDDVPV